ncbi:AAA family ATPase [Rhodococcus sp. 3Y1]
MSQRLGLAGALLGDPKVLLFDEPVNGLDPEGIVWIRKFMQRLAAEGRTVLVSSHLLSEMALTAEQLVVIGRGRLISDSTVAEFVDRSSESTVRVRSPQLDALHAALTAQGLTVREEHSGSEPVLVVVDSTTDVIGGLAGSQGIVLHELASVQGSLEDAFMKLTGDDVQYHASGIDPGAGTHHANTQHAMGGAL